eukprot:2959982-Pyramimonas_sp.AAC.1
MRYGEWYTLCSSVDVPPSGPPRPPVDARRLVPPSTVRGKLPASFADDVVHPWAGAIIVLL